MALFADGLLPASFRGAPFAVQDDAVSGGRRIAYHVFPGKDEPWAEDMGRAPRSWTMRGFIVDGDVVFLGGPIQLQRLLLLAALEKSGSGLLTHPTLGVLTVSVRRFSMGQDLGAGRKSSIEIEFVEAGKKSFPSLLSSSSGLLTAANLCKVALAVDGVRVLAAAIGAGGERSEVAASSRAWSDQTTALGADATALHRLAAQLPGPYGRFAGGGNTGLNGQRTTTYTTATTIADLVQVASAGRVAIVAAASVLTADIAGADLSAANDVAAGIVAVVQALADACADPADAIRLLEVMALFEPDGMTGDVQSAIAGMYRRAAAAALVTAVGAYQPTSADDADTLMSRVAMLLGDLAETAADAGDDQSFTALRSARGAIVTDLRARGGSLAGTTTYRFARALPSLMLAQRLYRDATRADQLVRQAPACRHPLFMPPIFDALAA